MSRLVLLVEQLVRTGADPDDFLRVRELARVASTWDRVLSTTLTIAAVVLVTIVGVRELRPAPKTPPPGSAFEPAYFPQWQSISARAHVLGVRQGPIHLTEFSDIECPGCRMFHLSTLPEIRAEFGSQVTIEFVHFPLPQHRFARAAAAASECAAEHGRFSEFVQVAMVKQDSLGLKSWGSYAREAGVTDTTALVACAKRPLMSARADSGRALGQSVGVRATPTVLVNGWRVSSATPDEIKRVVRDLLAGLPPYRGVDTTGR